MVQRAPPPNKTGVWGGHQLVQAPPHWKNVHDPKPHHGMAEPGAGFRARAQCKPPGRATEEGRKDQQGSVAGVAVGILPPQYIAVTHEPQ